ncbi:MAG: hypothetical protein ACOX6I_06560 [Syntrophomonadaceae bacterium]|jgi:hypothetical protein
MKRISISLVLLLCIGIISGCQPSTNNSMDKSKNDTKAQPNQMTQTELPSDYYPLTVGSYWEYEGMGNEFAGFTRKVLFSKGNLAQTTEDNGGTVSTRIFETTDTAVRIIYFSGEDYEPENLLETDFTTNENDIILQAPIKTGTTWGGTDTVRKSIVDTDAVVDTPAGKFDNCIKVESAGANSTIYQYFKKDTGMVKQEFISGDTSVTSTLKSYEIK